MNKLFTVFGILAASVLVLFPQGAEAVVVHGLNYEYSGAQSPVSLNDPWLTAKYETDGTDVKVTLEATNLTDKEAVKEWYINFDGDATKLSILEGNPPTTDIDEVLFGNDMYKAGPDGKFDILVKFVHSPEVDRFFGGESVMFTLHSSMGPITAEMFDVFSTPVTNEKGPFQSAAHIIGIGADGSGSGWIAPIPEPETYALLGAMLGVGMVVARRKKQRA